MQQISLLEMDKHPESLLRSNLHMIYVRTDRMFAGLMIFQWIAGIVIALVVSPRTWQGAEHQVHIHVLAAIFLGGAISLGPVFLALTQPGAAVTRQVIAIGQMLTSALLIHLTGGQIETHFHVFGSLAFLAFYRDWRVLTTATVVVYVDHLFRGLYWPQSVYGVLSAPIARTLEHAGWVIFEDVFLFLSIQQSLTEMKRDAEGTVQLVRENAERRLAQAALLESEERFERAVRGSNDGLWDWNIVTNDVYYSPRFKALLGYEEFEFDNTFDAFKNCLHPDDAAKTLESIDAHLKDAQPFDVEYRLRRKSGDYRWFRARGEAMRTTSNTAVRMAGSIIDITSRKTAEDQLRHDAYHDALTGLPNRAAFIDTLARAFANAHRKTDYGFAVLFLDLDRFKVINDSLGHLAGDKLLVTVARRLETCLRGGDMVARLGGDEFTVFLDDISQSTNAIDATKVAERIIAALVDPCEVNGEEVFTAASIGIAFSNTNYENPEDILRDADTALYRAKGAGRARFAIFDAIMHEKVTALLHLETDLRRAVERGQLFLHYQPIVSLQSRQITGFEALVRWQHPEHGLISPAEFIPLAEETGIIVQIGSWVLREACRWMRQGQLNDPAQSDITVSVNVSGRQFAAPGFCDVVQRVLQETGLSPHDLKLEITESTVMGHAESASRIFAELRALNVQLMIDDFGTGYSSLSYLSRFMIDALKIDRSFISKLASIEDSTEIVRCILVLASTLNLDVIAEGVETNDQAEALLALGCKFGQGFSFSRPVDGATAWGLLAQTSPATLPAAE